MRTSPVTAACREPREPAHLGSVVRGALLLAFALLVAPGCTIIFPPETCVDLDEVCPNLVCETYKANDEGCPICECADTEPPPTTCWDDSDCGGGQRCDVENYCETPPGCVEGEACPDVCYGRCVDAPSGCTSDSDCGPDEYCQFGGAGRPAPEPDEGGMCDPSSPDCQQDPMPYPEEGVCVPFGCVRDTPFPDCPPGTRLDYEYGPDGCSYPVCVPVDACAGLSPEACAQNPDCEGIYTDPNRPGQGGGSDGGAAPCMECDEAGNCYPCEEPMPPPPPEEDPPEQEFICVPRDPVPGDCSVDGDCGPGQVCQIERVCGGTCYEDPTTGQVICEDYCEEYGICVELEPSGCEADADCGAGYRCELTEVCTDCAAPYPGDDEGAPPPDCASECFVVGQCVYDDDYTVCMSDQDCGAGETCDMQNYCELPPECADANGDVACPPVCYGRCIAPPPPPPPPPGEACYSDADCAEGLVCNTWDACGTPPPDCPGCLIACEGFCEDPNAGNDGYCLDDGDCAADERCATELEICAHPEGTDPNVCYSLCVDREPPPEPGVCLEDADCAEGERCATELDVCVCPAGQTCDVCYSMCVPVDPDAP